MLKLILNNRKYIGKHYMKQKHSLEKVKHEKHQKVSKMIVKDDCFLSLVARILLQFSTIFAIHFKKLPRNTKIHSIRIRKFSEKYWIWDQFNK